MARDCAVLQSPCLLTVHLPAGLPCASSRPHRHLQVSALSQLELCLAYQRHWCDHKPSITVTVREEEWLDVGAWVYKHFDEMSGEQQAC